MRFLISTFTQDIHAAAVALALRARGHAVDVHHGADYPARQSQSIRIGPATPARLRVADAREHLDFERPDVVWARRRMRGTTPEALHAGDRAFARRELVHVGDAVWALAGADAFWINPRAAVDAARLKPLQLAAARASQMSIPETLFSNDPDEIRAFVREVGDAAYKAATPVGWTNARGGFAAVYTARVRTADLANDVALRCCPGIYQRFVPKAYELRVTILGRSVFATRIHSAEIALAESDWRRAQGSTMRYTPHELPAAIEERALALMDRLGLVYGCMDFIVTPEGEHVFLEVNEMGQFLWVERECPEVPMLDAFVRFCESRDPAFRYTKGPAPLSLAAVCAGGAADAYLAAEAALHDSPGLWHVSQDEAA